MITLQFAVSLFCIQFCDLLMLFVLEPAYRVFIHEKNDWCAQGHYESIINRTPTVEDYITWSKDENNKEFVRVLGVSVLTLIFLNFCFIYIYKSDNF